MEKRTNLTRKKHFNMASPAQRSTTASAVFFFSSRHWGSHSLEPTSMCGIVVVGVGGGVGVGWGWGRWGGCCMADSLVWIAVCRLLHFLSHKIHFVVYLEDGCEATVCLLRAFPSCLDEAHPCLVPVQRLCSDRPEEERDRMTQCQLEYSSYHCNGKERHEQGVPKNWACWFFQEAHYELRRSKKVR